MKHLSVSELWQFKSAELEADARLDVQTHLQLCSKCSNQLEQVDASLAVLRDLPPVPELPEALSQRVERQLRLAESTVQPPWWAIASWWRPALAAMALAMALFALWSGFKFEKATTPPAVATGEQNPPRSRDLKSGDIDTSAHSADTDSKVTTPALSNEPPLFASVAKTKNASHRNSNTDTAKLKPAQQLAAGSVVKTEKDGALWMTLPDGTRAGLTGASEVTLTTLQSKAVALSVTSGSLAMDVPHREDRVLTVQAGAVSIRDLGTRFLVSREQERVLVAVEEGSVEVSMNGHSETLNAGAAIEWHDGHIDRHAWTGSTPKTSPERVKPVANPGAASLQAPPVELPKPDTAQAFNETAEAKLPVAKEDDTSTEPSSDPGEWNNLPAAAVPAPPPPPQVTASPTPKQNGVNVFGLRGIEQRLNELGRNIHMSTTLKRQDRAAAIVALGDAGDCQGVLIESELFFRDAYSFRDAYKETALEKQLRRSVLFQKARCLSKVGRVEEAEAVRRQINSIQ